MKSKTKNILTEEQIKYLVKVNFGDIRIGKITELKGGMFNSAYQIERLQEQDVIVLKVSLRPDTKTLTYESNLMSTEVHVLELIEKQTTIPVPKLLAVDLTKKYIPSDYFFMTALKGIAMNQVQKKMSKENLKVIKQQLAQYMAQLHQMKGTYFGYFTMNQRNQYVTWREAFISMMENVLKDARENKIKLPYKRYEMILKNGATYLDEIKEPSLVDYDLWAGNVFLKKVNEVYEIEGIIDFERAFWGDPMADFKGSIMLLEHIFKEQDIWNAYQKEMRTRHVITKNDQIRGELYSLYIYTIMAAETFRYGSLYATIQKTYAKQKILKCLDKLEKAYER